jgi:hypothetical protein
MGMPDVGRFFLEKIRNISLRAECLAGHRHACGRRFAAEVWDMPEDDPDGFDSAALYFKA